MKTAFELGITPGMEWPEILALVCPEARAHAIAPENNKGLPKDAFHALCGISSCIVEVVPVFTGGSGEAEILYLRREQDDKEFQGVHTPGTVVRQWGSETYPQALARLMESELPGAKYEVVKELGIFEQDVPPRGFESAQVFVVELKTKIEVVNGEWHPIGNFPQDLLAYQRQSFLPEAVKFIQGLGT